MLIRFTFENVYSFGSHTELSLIPNTRLKTLMGHVYHKDKFEVLKLAALYGANGAGKSNMIKGLEMMKGMVKRQEHLSKYKRSIFRLRENSKQSPQLLVVEFFQDEIPFYYGLQITQGVISKEELYVSGLGKKEDRLIFERTTNASLETSIRFSEAFESDAKSIVLKDVLLEEFVVPEKTILKLIAKRENTFLSDAKKAFQWFDETLQILTPDSRPTTITHLVGEDTEFKEFAENIIRAVGVGITSLKVERKPFEVFLGENPSLKSQEIEDDLGQLPDGPIGIINLKGVEYTVTKEGRNVWVEKLLLGHQSEMDESVLFELVDESDGTIRLLEFVPAFLDLFRNECVYFIDEIERSMHPSLIRELLRNFSKQDNSKGQMIFTTHESNLLDQEIFRQDEIWFVEKNQEGSSSLYSLNDFKEHKTIDVRKGYLSGRYGAIPFLANLESINWS